MTVMMVERELQIIKSWLLIETELVTILKVCCLLTQHMMDIRVDNFNDCRLRKGQTFEINAMNYKKQKMHLVFLELQR